MIAVPRMDRLKKLLVISVVHASLIGLTVDQAMAAAPLSSTHLRLNRTSLRQREQWRFAQIDPSKPAPAEPRSSFNWPTNWQSMGGWLVFAGLPIALMGAAWYLSRRRSQASDVADTSASGAEALHSAAQLPEAAEITEFEQLKTGLTEASGDIAQVNLTPSSVASTTRLAKVDIVEALIADLQHPDRAKRCQTIWELGQRGDSRAVQPLVDALAVADSQQRGLILAAIAEISTRTLKPVHRALVLSLQDESADVRKNAIRDVTRIYDSMGQVRQLLQYAVDDGDVEVQETAQWALNQLNRLRPLPEVESVHAIEKLSDSQHFLDSQNLEE